MNTPTSAEPIVAQIRSASSWWRKEAGEGVAWQGEGRRPCTEGESSKCSKADSPPSEDHPHLAPLGNAMGPQQDVKLT